MKTIVLHLISERQTLPASLDRILSKLPDVGDGVMDQLQSRDQEVFVEVFSGENLSGHFTNIEEPEAVPVAPPLSQI